MTSWHPFPMLKSWGLCSRCARDFMASVRNSALKILCREGTWLLRKFYLFCSIQGFRLGTFSCIGEEDSHQGGQRVNYSVFLLGDTVHGSLNIPHGGLLPGAAQTQHFLPSLGPGQSSTGQLSLVCFPDLGLFGRAARNCHGGSQLKSCSVGTRQKVVGFTEWICLIP